MIFDHVKGILLHQVQLIQVWIEELLEEQSLVVSHRMIATPQDPLGQALEQLILSMGICPIP
jgi:hypothetical protein